MLNIPRHQIHLGLLLYLVCMTLLARIGHFPSEDWVNTVLRTNLITIFAFLAIFHLLTTCENRALASSSDYWLVMAVFGLTLFTGFIGVKFDVSVVMGGVAAYYFFRSARMPDGAFLALVYFALMINGFLTPFVFQIFKPFFLNGEAQLATMLNYPFGIDLIADGVLIHSNNGIKFQMIGGCSVFSNVSFAFLGYAAIKGFLRSRINAHDWIIVAILLIALIVGNSVRIGLMTFSMEAYEYWHNGDGAVVFGLVQFAAILFISLLPFVRWRRA